MSTTEPRALTAALQAPAFVTRGGGAALHAANRHVERWAPEASASRFRPLANLGFVDRLVTPWIESAQRSASLRMFSQIAADGPADRAPASVSWVFPRPWYQDELDWMAAARQIGARTAMEQPAPSMLTTRGTFVAPAQAMPRELHEYVAPSLSLARPDVATLGAAYSPLVPFAATEAAHVMARAVAPIGAVTSPGLRAVLSTLLARTTAADEIGPTRTSMYAPELVTPPAPRAGARAGELGARASVDVTDATQVADRYAEQHDRIAELQRLARQAAERELVARQAAEREVTERQQATAAPSQAALDEVRAAQARAVEHRQAEIQRRLADAGARRPSEPTGDTAAERARIEERIAQRLAAVKQQESVRLHEQSREAAARDARAARAAEVIAPARARDASEARPQSHVVAEIAAAVSALPPELASMVAATIGERPERAVQAIAELGDALRSVELIARTTAAGGTFEPTRGPRVVMPAGLGGLVSTVARTSPETALVQRMPIVPFAQPAARAAAPTSALAAATSAKPAALMHVAWSDRWLARLAGARPQSLDVLAMASSPELHAPVLATAAAAPSAVFVAPMFEDRSARPEPRGELGFDINFSGAAAAARGLDEPLPTLRGGPAPAQPVVRFDDDAETPDEMLAAISMAATRTRASVAAPAAANVQSASGQAPAATPTIDPDRYQPRATLADLVAQAAPSAPGAGLAAALASSPFAPALRHVLSLGSAPTFDVRALFGAGLSSTYLDGLLGAATTELAIDAPTLGAFEPGALEPDGFEPRTREVAELDLPFVTLRSALLSADIETNAASDTASGVAAPSGVAAASAVAAQASLARTIVDTITLPMLADTAVREPAGERAMTYAAPGMIAERAESWSVAQERSSADLSFDFVPPELVLAARVYGLGPAEAAQAARLAIVGAGQLSAMASAVDRTFVQALSIEVERRGERARLVTAYPLGAGDTAQAVIGASTPEAAALAQLAPAASAFGVERRAPRGAFLWPSATTAALGLQAASPHGEQGISVAALELLAAQAVAELGTYAALGEHTQLGGEHTQLGGEPRGSVATSAMTIAEQRDEDVPATASALVPESRRDKFQALYVALSQSPAGRAASPAARAARALALAGRGDDTVSARERATIAWDVLPVVYGLADAPTDEPLSSGDAAAREMRRRDELRAIDPVLVDTRPGLGALSARAGEALGAYVAPAAPSAPPSSASHAAGDVGAVLRAPTAAPELVRTGGRFGGGEVEIPAWFEAAARKMFEDKSGSSVADGISIAELTLISTAPVAQIAASSRSEGGRAAAPAPAATPAGGEQKQQVDIEKLANDVYREVLVLMDIARSRNGEPYL